MPTRALVALRAAALALPATVASLLLPPPAEALWIALPLLAFALLFRINLGDVTRSDPPASARATAPAPAIQRLLQQSSQLLRRLPVRPRDILALLLLGAALAQVVLYATSIPEEVYLWWLSHATDNPSSPPALVLWSALLCFAAVAVPAIPGNSRKPIARVAQFLAPLGAAAAGLGYAILLLQFSEVSALVLGALVLVWAALHILKQGLRAAALAACVFVAAGAVIMLVPPAPPRSNAGAGLREAVLRLFPDYPLLVTIPGSGEGHSRIWFGANAELSDKPLLELRSTVGGRYYVTLETASELTGSGWVLKPLEALSPGDAPVAQPAAPALRVSTIGQWWHAVPPRIQAGTRVFLPVQVEARDLRDGRPLEPLGPGTTVAYAPMLAGGPSGTGGEVEPEGSRNLVMTLIPPPQIRELAQEARDLGFARQEALALAYTQERFAYGLDTSAPAVTEHPLAPFFREAKGYCVHFATFAAVYFSELGYPVRYRSGYAGTLQRLEDYDNFGGTASYGARIHGLDAHAWIEVLTADGWRIVDLTPPVRFQTSYAGYAPPDALTRAYLDRLFAREAAALAGAGSAEPASGDAGSEWLLPALLGCGLVTFVALGSVAARRLRPRARWEAALRSFAAALAGSRGAARGSVPPPPLAAVETVIGSRARELYLPSLELWFGYDRGLSYRELRARLALATAGIKSGTGTLPSRKDSQ